MTASSIRIHRTLERDIGRVVVADDRARALRLERRGDAVGCLIEVPAMVHRLELLKIEAAGRIGQRSPDAVSVAACDVAAHSATVLFYRTTVKPPAERLETL